jgi:hypothetical protein
MRLHHHQDRRVRIADPCARPPAEDHRPYLAAGGPCENVHPACDRGPVSVFTSRAHIEF